MVLGILAEGESYGYAILRRINELSGGELDWTEGLLYPLLHRLERLGYVASSWRSVAGQRRRKYYRITNDGLIELARQRHQWDTVADALRQIWLGPGDVRSLTALPMAGPVWPRPAIRATWRPSKRSGATTCTTDGRCSPQMGP